MARAVFRARMQEKMREPETLLQLATEREDFASLLNLSVSCQSLPPTPGSGMTSLKVSSGAGDAATGFVEAVGLDCACAKSTSSSE